jgi:hypothetical protein
MVVRMCCTDTKTGQMMTIDLGLYFHWRGEPTHKWARACQACSRVKSRSRVLGSMAVATMLTMAQLKM